MHPQVIPHSIQDLPNTPADLAAQIQPNITGFNHFFHPWSTNADMPGVNDSDALEVGDAQHFDPWSAVDLQCLIAELETAPDGKLVVVEAPAAPALEDGRPPGRDDDTPEVNATSTSPPEPGSTVPPDQTLTYISQKLLEEDEKPVEAPAPKDGHPSCRDADMTEVNAAAPQPGPLGRGGDVCATSKHVEEEAPFSSFKSAIEQDLLGQGHTPTGCDLDAMAVALSQLQEAINAVSRKKATVNFNNFTLSEVVSLYLIAFTGHVSKGRKPHHGGWKETSMKGLRAVADPSSPQPLAPGQQQRYVGLKKTLERDDGNGNKWRAHEYTPLLPADDGSDKLIPAEISLRVEFKQDEPPPPPPAMASSSMKRKEDEAPLEEVAFTKRPKIAPKKSPVWEHMTRVHVKVAPATNKDGTQRRKNPHYKVMFAICHHCDQVFNADSSNGTHNLSNHLDCCNDCKCTHSPPR